jgi:pimeloyl-ACP methyl ester carboxylesterase
VRVGEYAPSDLERTCYGPTVIDPLDASLPPAVAAALEAPRAGVRSVTQAAGIPFSALSWRGDDVTGSIKPPGSPAGSLLLIHGITASASIWWRVGPALAATGRRVIAVDLPGHGQTGHWTGRHRFRETASAVAAFVSAADLAVEDLQVIGHSWGAMIAAALPVAGLRPSTIVLLDPPAVSHAVISQMVEDPDSRAYDDLDEAIAAVRRQNPGWVDEDVRASAEALTCLDEAAARSVLLENGDWDGGIGDLATPAARGVPVWVVRGDPVAGSLTPDSALAAYVAIIGTDRVVTIPDGAHSPFRLHPVETTSALLGALTRG